MKNWKVIFWPILAFIIFSIVAICLLLKFSPRENITYYIVQSISTIALAIATITLVLVTSYHARISSKIINEERGKRTAEFGEKRIKEGFVPLINKFIDLDRSVTDMQPTYNPDLIQNKLKDINSIRGKMMFHYKDTLHLYKNEMRKKIDEYIDDTQELIKDLSDKIIHFRKKIYGPASLRGQELDAKKKQFEALSKEWKAEFLNKTKKIIKSIEHSRESIEVIIKKTYGYYTDKQ